MSIIIIILAILFIVLVIKNYIKLSPNSYRSNKPIHLNFSIPDPEKVNDYRFYKFVQSEPKSTLEMIYPEIKKRKIKLKQNFENAILTKIRTGKFDNPLDFKEYFGDSFDLIGVQFLKGTDNLLSAFQIGVCFIQNKKIADIETYDFRPPEKIVETKRFQKALEQLEIDLEFIEDFSFQDVWETFELKIFFNKNLVVCWNEEYDILKKVLKYNRIQDYNINCIKIKEIAQQNNLPDTIDSLLSHFGSDLNLKDDISLIVSSLAVELKENGIELEHYIHKLTAIEKTTKSRQSKQIFDFEGHDKIQGDLLKPDLENADVNSPFYNKKVVFTGVLENINRQEAAKIVKDMGADIDTSITKRTNFVVIGIDPGPSKMNKIIKYNNEGCDIKILYEKDFLKMIENK